MSITILKAGIADSFRDSGRHGYRNIGINPGGAQDLLAAALANLLVGNPLNEGVLEFFYPGPALQFNTSCMVTIAGADFQPLINKKTIHRHQPIYLQKGDLLHFAALKKGRVAYLAIAGGFLMEQWLQSCSTNTLLIKGGYKGRRLQQSDTIAFKKHLENHYSPAQPRWQLPPSVLQELYGTSCIQIIEGDDGKRLTKSSRQAFLQQPFIINNRSDRMGYALDGPPLITTITTEALSSGVQAGTLQLLPDGGLIALMADHQTTGGYPKIAHIIKAHRPRFAQLSAGQKLYFEIVSLQTAEERYRLQQNRLRQLELNTRQMLDHWTAQHKIKWQ